MPNDTPLTLQQLMAMVKHTLSQGLPGSYWLQAELSECRENATGHCYLEFVEKNERTGGFAAKARGVIWRGVYGLLKPYFERTTGSRLQAGLKVLVKVSVSFHEQYGLSLVVSDIDPTYTLGDMARRRKEILDRLEREGVIGMNRELPLPRLVQRVAVISSGTAAGYGDFCNQLAHNGGGFAFYTRLFPATMQGERVAQSIIGALNAILLTHLPWDAVVIIRGGGAVSDLGGFESYDLANNCAQFPLPIITGIGHERDDTVIDFVANTRCKTPTAVADFLINRMAGEQESLIALATGLRQQALNALHRQSLRLQTAGGALPRVVSLRCSRELARRRHSEAALRLAAQTCLAQGGTRTAGLSHRLHVAAAAALQTRKAQLERRADRLPAATQRLMERHRERLGLAQQTVRLMGPEHLLALGYSITLCNGHAVTRAESLEAGQLITTRFAHGHATSRVVGVEASDNEN